MPARKESTGPVRRRDASVSIRDVAEAAGVSMMTVSRALRGVEGVSEAKRTAILKIAQRLNYTPNSNARALAAANSDLVGISLPTLFYDVFPDILAGMRRTFATAGFASVLDTTDYSPEAELAWVDRVLPWHPAGLILTGMDHHPALPGRLARAGVPVLEIWDIAEEPLDICVGIDHHAAGVQVGRYAVGLGYRRPAYIGTTAGRDARAEARLRGLEAAFAEVPGTAPMCVARRENPNDFVAGREGAEAMIARHPRPDVLFFLSDHYAFGGVTAALSAGLSIPQDIGIVGFNALDLTAVLPVPLTTVRTPRREMGVAGAQNLLARIKGVTPPRTLALPVTVVPGATTRGQG